MSFDLYFVPRPSDGRWDGVMDQLESGAADGGELTSQDLGLWAQVVGAATAVIPDAEEIGGGGYRQLDDGVGIQVSLFPGELSITTPYWYEGQDAERVVEKLRQVATAIESVTDLVAYDPQADAPFLGDGDTMAVASFDSAAVVLRDLGTSSPTRSAVPRWEFWRR
ncbi:MAG: hypothetical protein WBA45_08600 [Microthrixaceae bacterium]